jgi:hypothetical protein
MSKAEMIKQVKAILTKFESLGCTEHSSPNGDTIMRRSCDFTIEEFAGANGKESPTWVTREGSDSEFTYVRGKFNCSEPMLNELLGGMQLARIPKKSYDESPMELGSCYSAQCNWRVSNDEDELYPDYADRTLISVFSNLASVSSIKSIFEM